MELTTEINNRHQQNSQPYIFKDDLDVIKNCGLSAIRHSKEDYTTRIDAAVALGKINDYASSLDPHEQATLLKTLRLYYSRLQLTPQSDLRCHHGAGTLHVNKLLFSLASPTLAALIERSQNGCVELGHLGPLDTFVLEIFKHFIYTGELKQHPGVKDYALLHYLQVARLAHRTGLQDLLQLTDQAIRQLLEDHPEILPGSVVHRLGEIRQFQPCDPNSTYNTIECLLTGVLTSQLPTTTALINDRIKACKGNLVLTGLATPADLPYLGSVELIDQLEKAHHNGHRDIKLAIQYQLISLLSPSSALDLARVALSYDLPDLFDSVLKFLRITSLKWDNKHHITVLIRNADPLSDELRKATGQISNTQELIYKAENLSESARDIIELAQEIPNFTVDFKIVSDPLFALHLQNSSRAMKSLFRTALGVTYFNGTTLFAIGVPVLWNAWSVTQSCVTAALALPFHRVIWGPSAPILSAMARNEYLWTYFSHLPWKEVGALFVTNQLITGVAGYSLVPTIMKVLEIRNELPAMPSLTAYQKFLDNFYEKWVYKPLTEFHLRYRNDTDEFLTPRPNSSHLLVTKSSKKLDLRHFVLNDLLLTELIRSTNESLPPPPIETLKVARCGDVTEAGWSQLAHVPTISKIVLDLTPMVGVFRGKFPNVTKLSEHLPNLKSVELRVARWEVGTSYVNSIKEFLDTFPPNIQLSMKTFAVVRNMPEGRRYLSQYVHEELVQGDLFKHLPQNNEVRTSTIIMPKGRSPVVIKSDDDAKRNEPVTIGLVSAPKLTLENVQQLLSNTPHLQDIQFSAQPPTMLGENPLSYSRELLEYVLGSECHLKRVSFESINFDNIPNLVLPKEARQDLLRIDFIKCNLSSGLIEQILLHHPKLVIAVEDGYRGFVSLSEVVIKKMLDRIDQQCSEEVQKRANALSEVISRDASGILATLVSHPKELITFMSEAKAGRHHLHPLTPQFFSSSGLQTQSFLNTIIQAISKKSVLDSWLGFLAVKKLLPVLRNWSSQSNAKAFENPLSDEDGRMNKEADDLVSHYFSNNQTELKHFIYRALCNSDARKLSQLPNIETTQIKWEEICQNLSDGQKSSLIYYTLLKALPKVLDLIKGA